MGDNALVGRTVRCVFLSLFILRGVDGCTSRLIDGHEFAGSLLRLCKALEEGKKERRKERKKERKVVSFGLPKLLCSRFLVLWLIWWVDWLG